MKYYFSEITKAISYINVTIRQPNIFLESIATDSRNIHHGEQVLFFALKGKRLDGHFFISEAYEKGVRNFIVTKNIDTQVFRDANFLVVDDAIIALQQLAAFHRTKFDLPIIAITGSNGKTIIKEWLYQMLMNEYFIVRSPRSFNSQIGVPLSLLAIHQQHDLGIFEVGISLPNEMNQLESLINCDIGVFSNIGDAHNEGFDNIEQKIKEKLELFKNTKCLIYRSDYALIRKNIPTTLPAFSWGQDENANLKILITKKPNSGHSSVEGMYKNGEKVFFNIPFIDDASLENAIHCCCVLLHMGFASGFIQQRLHLLKPVALRLELKAGINQCLVINDFYNFDLTSLAFALDFMEQHSVSQHQTVILSDILQSGLMIENLYQQVANELNDRAIKRVIGIGSDINFLKKYLLPRFEFQHFNTTDEFIAFFKPSQFHQEMILLKGARDFEFERIAPLLELKAHRTVLEINLNALRHNLGAYTRRLAPSTKILVMVKASAYGSGSTEVAKLLAYHRVDYLGVAYTDEAVTLRREGITLPIMVLNAEESTFHALLKYDIEPEIYSLEQLYQLLPYVSNSKKILKIHLKIDTGMKRLGFENDNIETLVEVLSAHKMLVVQSVFSHLVASDSADHDSFSMHQINTFLTIYENLATKLGYRPMRHICNTGAIVRFPAYHFEMVRLGIGLYGIDSSSEIQQELQVVNTLKATISQIKYVKKGESVGYSRRGVVEKDSRTATISIGYADGFLRAAGNGRYAVGIRGQLASTVGNVCMDMCMIDVTDIADVAVGDEVVIFGQHPRVETLADATQTIAYEIFTNVSDRVKRVYFSE